MIFEVARGRVRPGQGIRGIRGILRYNNWNDHGFVSSFNLSIRLDDIEHEIGYVKFGRMGAEPNGEDVGVPASFTELPHDFFSLGQSPEYYENLRKFEQSSGISVASALRDIVADVSLFDEVQEEHVTIKSLLRSLHIQTVEDQFHRVYHGGPKKIAYCLRFAPRVSGSQPAIGFNFKVNPSSALPTNMHVLIGSNGVGKSTLLRSMRDSFQKEDGRFTIDQESGQLGPGPSSVIANMMVISFSYFDEWESTEENSDRRRDVKVLGLATLGESKNRTAVSSGSASVIVVDAIWEAMGICGRTDREELLRDSYGKLEIDRHFRAIGLANCVGGTRAAVEDVCSQLSSGHKISILIVTLLIAYVQEKSLVLIDEPESHLHPPLLAALVRVVTEVLDGLNGIAIVATHSPVVLQEVPRDCVWVLTRSGDALSGTRPIGETFGENVGSLTRQVFGHEIMDSGFYRRLSDVSVVANSYEEALSILGGALGGEGRLLLRKMMADRA